MFPKHQNTKEDQKYEMQLAKAVGLLLDIQAQNKTRIKLSGFASDPMLVTDIAKSLMQNTKRDSVKKYLNKCLKSLL